MSNSKKLFIAFCEENKNVAEQITQDLGKAGFKFDLLSNKFVDGQESLTKLILQQTTKGLLLISDNFLKSTTCVRDILGLINNSKALTTIQIVIIDGRYPQKTGSGFETVETTFDRVSSVIKYMNFWQEKYLDIRKNRRSIPPAELPEFDLRVESIKKISSEIGDFLRILQTKNYWDFPNFENNAYELFFKKFGDDAGHKLLKSLMPTKPATAAPPADKAKPENVKSAADKEIVLPVFEEKVAEIDVKSVEKKSAPQPDPVSSSGHEPTGLNVKKSAAKNVEQKALSGISTPFEKQVQEIIDEIEEEEQGYEEENTALDPSFESFETDFGDEEEEDITADFDAEEDISEPTEKTVIAENAKTKEPKREKVEQTADEMIVEASTLIDNGKIGEAITKLNETLKLYPQNNGARYMYAMVLLNYEEDHAKAEKQLKKVVEYDPQNWEAFEHLAKIAEINNDFHAAKKYYEQVVAIKPNTFGVYYKLGLITSGFFSDKKKLASKYFKKEIRQNPENDDAWYRFALLLDDNPKKAAKLFKKVLKINPQHQFANYDLALLYNEFGESKKAARYYKKAWKINPEIRTPLNDVVFKYDNSTTESQTPETLTTASNLISQSEKTALSPDDQKNPDTAKVVFITGATSGIGKATAKIFAAKGYRLILNGRREERLDILQKEFSDQYETDSLLLPFDVRNIEEVKNAIENLDEKWRDVDILINNAGLAKGYAPIHEGNPEHWETMIDTNLKGLLYLTRAITPHMVKRRSGQIINICSSAGHEVYPNGNVYCATKFAVDALTKAMRLDLYKHNIRVGQVSPGHVEETEFALVRFEDEERAKIYEDFQPLKSEDVAKAIYFMVTAPPHVNIQEVRMTGTQQASNVFIDRSGR